MAEVVTMPQFSYRKVKFMNRKFIVPAVFSIVLAVGIYLFSGIIKPNDQKKDDSSLSNVPAVFKKSDYPDAHKNNLSADAGTYSEQGPGKTRKGMQERSGQSGEDKRKLQRQGSGFSLTGAALKDRTPAELSNIVLEYKDQPSASREPLHHALNRLCSLGDQGSQPAIDKLIELSYKFKDNRILHQTLQSLGRTGLPEANDALMDALSRNLDNPVEATRISSYFSPSAKGALDPLIVDKLITFIDNPGINSDSRSVLINLVFHKGGAYGRNLTRDIRISELREQRKSMRE